MIPESYAKFVDRKFLLCKFREIELTNYEICHNSVLTISTNSLIKSVWTKGLSPWRTVLFLPWHQLVVQNKKVTIQWFFFQMTVTYPAIFKDAGFKKASVTSSSLNTTSQQKESAFRAKTTTSCLKTGKNIHVSVQAKLSGLFIFLRFSQFLSE